MKVTTVLSAAGLLLETGDTRMLNEAIDKLLERDGKNTLKDFDGLLFVYGRPEWKPIVTAYIGLLLMGGCFISVGLFISSLTRNQIVAGMVTFAVFLLLWVINWVASFVGPTAQSVLNYLSITDHFDDFTKGILDTKHLVYYFSVISFGLFLTARSVDTERWKG